ncbi:MAG: metallophosphatase [Armatimonadota bacterium]|nr:metallophosphatase [bacterium]
MARITIFHTSDMHNRLTPEFASRLHDLKAANSENILLDSGDAIRAGNIYWIPGGEPALDFMNSVPYDAMCMGNREFHFLGAGVDSKISRANFPILSANLRASDKDRANPVISHAIFERSGVRLAVIGLTVPCITEKMFVKRVSDYYFDQPIAAAAEIVQALRSQTDIVIALTHTGINCDRELSEKVPGIDIILGGHTHIVADETLGRTRILHHGYYAQSVGRVDIDFDSGGITGVSNELIPLAKA